MGLALAVMGTGLFFCREFALSFSFPKLLILGAGVWLAAAGVAASPGRPLVRTSLDLPLAACLSVMALSLAGSTDRWLSLLGAENYSFGLWATAMLAALYWLTVQAASGREPLLLKLTLGAYGLVAFYAVLQAAGLELLSGMPELPSGRAYSTLGSPVALGEVMTLLLPVALYWVRSRKGELTGWVCLAALTCGLLASISRGAWLSALIACGIYLAMGSGQPRILTNPRRWALAVLACVILGLACAWTLRRRPLAPGDGGRTLIWRAAWDLFKERPLLGWGANSFSLAGRLKRTAEAVRLSSVREIPNHAHNDFLHVLATTGALGLAAYLWLCLALAFAALRAAKDPERPWAAALACGLLGLFLNMKVNPAPLEALAGAAFFAGLLADRRPNASSIPRGWSYSALAAATASALLVGRLAGAELSKRAAERLDLNGRLEPAVRERAQAVRANPWDMSYRLDYINSLAKLSSRLTPPTIRNRELLETARAAAREGVILHPRHPDAYYGEGIALLNLAFLNLSLQGALGDLEPARRALDRALALDATYVPTLQARSVIAQSQGDTATEAELARRISLIQDKDSFTRP